MKIVKSLIFVFCLVFGLNANAADPSVQAYNVAITGRYSSALSVSWTRGNGERCIVVCKPAANSYGYPVDGVDNFYNASSTYGSGDNLGNSNYVVYDGTGTSMTIYGLAASTNYTVIVYEYNTTFDFISQEDYYYYKTTVSSSNTESAYTLCTSPSVNATNLTSSSVSYTTANLSWTTGNSSYTLITLDNYSSGSSYYSPVDGVLYSASSAYGSGSLLTGDNYVVYNSSGTSVSLSNLMPATTYRAFGFEYCGSSTGSTWNYMTNSADDVYFTTLNYPPTLNTINNITRCMNSGAYAVSLSGITDGSTLESQTVTITATSSNTTLIPNGNISISYTNPNSTGTLTFTPATNQYGTSTITVTANDGFSSTNTVVRTFTVTVNPYPSAAGAITGNTTVCKNASNYVYSVPAITNATSYVWSFPSGTVIVSGSTTNSVTVNFPSAMSQSSGTVSVYGTNANGCGNGTSSSKTIYFDVAPTVATAGADLLTCNGTMQLQGNNPSVGTGLWDVVSGSANFNDDTQYNTNVTGIVSGQSVTLSWTISNGVCPSTSDQVIVTYNPAAPQCQIFADFFASNTSPCVNGSVDFTDNSVGATGWSWNFGGNATPNTSSVQHPTGIVFNSAGPQTITLTVTGPNGSDGETKNAYINVISLPGNAGAISGNTTVCEGDEQILYSVGSIANATDYIWTIPSGSFLNSGSNTNSISIDYIPGSVSGTLSVQGQNSCGTGGVSNLSITVNPMADPAGPITGSVDVCQGENGVQYSIPIITNATAYNWILPSGASIATNNGDNIEIDFSSSAISGNLIVYGSNACPADGDPDTLEITVNPLPGVAGGITGSVNITNCPVSTAVEYSIESVANADSYLWNTPTGSFITGQGNDTIFVDFAFGANSGNVSVMPQNACGNGTSNSLPIIVDDPVSQNLCLVSVDDSSTHNVIVWEKNETPVLESFNIYKEISTGVYNLIANRHVDSVSMYHDYSANPNTTSYKYKITAVDTCGNESEQSNYHSSIHLQFLGSGNLQWTLYEIENNTNPVSYYKILRDDSTSGAWNVIDSLVPGGNSTYTDVDYNLFTNPSYRVEVVWLISCSPSRAGVNTSRSNVKNAAPGPNAITDEAILNNIKLFPNPSNSIVQLSGLGVNTNIDFYNSVGQLVYSSKISGTGTIDVAGLPAGMYQVKVNWENYQKVIRFVKQ
jgi:hypothetical protein